MTRAVLMALSLAVAGGGGYLLGTGKLPSDIASITPWLGEPAVAETTATGAGRILYYRHPDGRFEYSGHAQKTTDGREFVAVRQSEDVNFQDIGKPSEGISISAKTERKVLYYRNPMGLPDTSPLPKKDSMGMDYIPVYKGEANDAGTVKVSRGKLQRTGVRSAEAVFAPIVSRIRAPGTVTLDERRIRMIAMRTEAFVETVADVTTGDRVKAGQPLFQFYSKDIAAAGVELATQREGSTEGGAVKLRNYGVSESVIDEIRRSRKVPNRIDYEAPVSGVVLERIAMAGMMAQTGEMLFRIADTSRIWVVAEIPESQLDAVTDGAKATITVRGLTGKTFNGKVSVIYPEIRSETRTVKARIELDNADGALRANMFADITIESGWGRPVVTVPDTAVIDTGDKKIVFLDLGDGRFEPRSVSTGMRGYGKLEITGGLQAGDRVVVAANFLIDAESNMTSALNSMISPEVRQ